LNIGKRVVEIVLKGTDNASGAFKGFEKEMSNLGKQFPLLSGAFSMLTNPITLITGAVAGLGAAMAKAYGDTVKLGASFEDMSQRTEMSVDALAKWKYIADQGGSSIDEFEAAFRKLRKTMADATNGDTAAMEVFARLGVSATDGAGNMRELEAVMLEIGQAVRQYGVESVQGAAAQEALGRSSAGVVAIIKQSKTELELAGREAGVFSSNMTSAWAASADAADDAGARYRAALSNLAAGAMPDMSGLRNWWTETLVMMFDAKGWVELQKLQEDQAKAAATEVATAYTDSLLSGLNAPSSDNSGTLAGQIINAKAADAEIAKLLGAIKAADLPAKITEMMDIAPMFGEASDEVGTLIEDFDEFALTLQTVAEAGLPPSMDAAVIAAGDEALKRLTETAAELTEEEIEVSNAAEDLANGLGSVASQGMAAFLMGEAGAMQFGHMLRTVVMQAISDLIVKLFIVKGLMKLFGSLGIPGLAQGGAVPMAHGGMIPRAALGYAVPDGPRGMDSRLIAAMPGEEVINRQLSHRLDRFISSMEFGAAVSPFAMSGAGGGRGNVIVNFEVGRPVGVLDALSYGEVAATAARKVAEANL